METTRPTNSPLRARGAQRLRLALAAALLLLASVVLVVLTTEPAAGPEAAPRAVKFRTQTMGTWATLTLVTADSAAVADLAYAALLSLHHTDSLMTNWTTTSEVARINRSAGRGATPISDEVVGVLALAQEVAGASDGAFDVTVEPLVRLWGFLGGMPGVPAEQDIAATRADVGWHHVRLDTTAGTVAFARPDLRIDLGGIAKGHGVDRVAEILRDAGVKNALVDLSGNMVALGSAPGREGWVIGIRDPDDRAPYLAALRLRDEAVATSGAYAQFVTEDGKRYGHILDPRSGWPAEGLASVTVVSRSAREADAWATALFVLGPAAARRRAVAREDLAVVLLEPGEDGQATLWVEESLRDRFSLSSDFTMNTAVRFF